MEAAGGYPAEIYMGLTEILLVVIGIGIFVFSFLIPESLGKDKKKEIKIPEEKIHQLIQKELKQAEFQIEEKTEETISAVTEKAERYMERVSNEKIMAVQEYSDTVLGQINRNHEEAVFLYDMLNNKHIQIKNTIAEMNHQIEDTKVEKENMILEQEAVGIQENNENEIISDEVADEINVNSVEDNTEVDLECEDISEAGNNKNKIFKLHKEGKSKVEIAKTLGLGIGEVKLVIDLFENAES